MLPFLLTDILCNVAVEINGHIRTQFWAIKSNKKNDTHKVSVLVTKLRFLNYSKRSAIIHP